MTQIKWNQEFYWTRQRLGIDPGTMAAILGISNEAYYDLETGAAGPTTHVQKVFADKFCQGLRAPVKSVPVNETVRRRRFS